MNATNSTPKSPLRILHLVEDELESEFVKGVLQSEGIACESLHVSREDQFRTALKVGGFDLIFSDYQLPRYHGITALRLAQELQPDVPFVFISGTIGEEKALEMLSEGAMDYVLKNYIGRIVPTVFRSLREAETRIERRKAEERLQDQAALIELARDAVYVQDPDYRIRFWNEGATLLYGWKSREAIGQSALKLLFRDVFNESITAFEQLTKTGEWATELRQVTADRRDIIVESRWTLIANRPRQPQYILVVNRDITAKKRQLGAPRHAKK